jgi:hypothetical protein
MDGILISKRSMLGGGSVSGQAMCGDLRSCRRVPLCVAGASEARDRERAAHRALTGRRAGCDRRSLASALRLLGVALALASLSGVALAQSSSASYQIPRQSIDGGAQRSTSATYTLEATIGQPDAGPVMTSGSYELRGGFHRPAATGPLPDPLFSDGFEQP